MFLTFLSNNLSKTWSSNYNYFVLFNTFFENKALILCNAIIIWYFLISSSHINIVNWDSLILSWSTSELLPLLLDEVLLLHAFVSKLLVHLVLSSAVELANGLSFVLWCAACNSWFELTKLEWLGDQEVRPVPGPEVTHDHDGGEELQDTNIDLSLGDFLFFSHASSGYCSGSGYKNIDDTCEDGEWLTQLRNTLLALLPDQIIVLISS